MPDPTGRDELLQAVRSARGEELDALISAWLDDELDPEQAAVLRERAANEPAVARRRSELESVDAALRTIVVPPVRAGLRAELQERIERDRAPLSSRSAVRSPAGTAAGRGSRIVPLRARTARWLVPAAAAALAALAAGLLLYFARGSVAPPGGALPQAQQIARSSGEEHSSDSGVGGTGVAPESPGSTGTLPAPDLALSPPSPPAPRLAADPPAPSAGVPELLAADPGADAAETGDAELAIAFEMDALRDFEVIDQLELLEFLDQQVERDARRATGAGSG